MVNKILTKLADNPLDPLVSIAKFGIATWLVIVGWSFFKEEFSKNSDIMRTTMESNTATLASVAKTIDQVSLSSTQTATEAQAAREAATAAQLSASIAAKGVEVTNRLLQDSMSNSEKQLAELSEINKGQAVGLKAASEERIQFWTQAAKEHAKMLEAETEALKRLPACPEAAKTK